jgi:hypothetical protein
MTAPPLKRPVLTCQRKLRWSDEFAARAAAMHRLEQPDQPLDRLWIYRCPMCAGWHLTSKRQATSMMVTAANPVHTKTMTR